MDELTGLHKGAPFKAHSKGRAAVAKLTVELRGMAELKKKLTPELYDKASHHILNHVVSKIAGTAQSRAPTGMKITHRVSKRHPPRSAVVRVSKTGLGKKARAIHGPIRTVKARSRPYTPNAAALAAWAVDKGIPVIAPIKSAQRRGTPFQPFMREGLEANKGAAQQALSTAEALVRKAWDA